MRVKIRDNIGKHGGNALHFNKSMSTNVDTTSNVQTRKYYIKSAKNAIGIEGKDTRMVRTGFGEKWKSNQELLKHLWRKLN